MPERKPATDAVLTMTPPPRLAMWRTATLVHLTTPVIFTLGKLTSTSSTGFQNVNVMHLLFEYLQLKPTFQRQKHIVCSTNDACIQKSNLLGDVIA